jgi:hypothetical protein
MMYILIGNGTLLRVILTFSLPQIESCVLVEYFTALATHIFCFF